MTLSAASTDDEAFGLDPVQREAYEWISRFMRGDMTSAEVEAMKTWYGRSQAHSAAYADARRAWNALGPIASARMQESTGSAPTVQANSSRTRRSAPIGRRALIGGALAASTAFVLAKPPLDLWPSYSELMADYRTAAGEQRQVTLADTVSLDLNTKTSISVRSQTADQTQIELIAGEVAFSTSAASSELTVFAASGRIVTTRSDFNLRCDGSHVSIVCLDGSLNVMWNNNITRLNARQQISYSDQGVSGVMAADPENVMAWRHGQLIFEGTPVAEVVAEINRYRSGRIVLVNEDIGRRLLTARLPTSQTDRIVTQIVHIFGAKARYLPGGIVLLA
ncbi:FecR family protein [Bradyrhizobium cenepequi]|uniref:FecR family protein n=1 Tax=Bradyrhizobium cenepequi TaxID=2821403 RepID=UPI001CE34EEA|nr:FecR domain-containing protein [Bradyrhizobium cenepequi]MCA6112681.1 FecR domain-containing protein [Bradyrhizobium cenepequi]